MKLWRWILLLVLLAALAAFGWHWVATDPGYVLVRLRGWEAQTTVLVAVIIVVLAVLVLVWLWRLARWPFGAAGRRHRRVSRKQLQSGLVFLAEGHYAAAEKALTRAARYAPQKGAALLMAARAAARRGDDKTAQELLDKATIEVPLAARSERARLLRRAHRADEAVALLAPQADSGKLSPEGWLELVKAALAAGEPARAHAALEPLRKSGALEARALAELETRILVATIETSKDGAALKILWSSLPKAQRRQPEVVDAYARCAARFGQSMAAMGEIEAALNRQWSPLLVETWGALEGEDVETRLRRAETWLGSHPDDPALLSTLGRLCARLEVWGKARDYLARALALEPSAATWEALGEVHAAQHNVLLSQRCYRNALHLYRHEPVEPLPGSHVGSGQADAPVADRRDEHGLPRLPAEGRAARDK
ncbi:MAG TPA: heme biosynthesis HemY N-terminal domain-containing protein [Rhodanobacteraceae bacterium]|nr:heme biosynthesis HemY N-terminal domain-containing protein [Rhodanobacteraceae bacterium]